MCCASLALRCVACFRTIVSHSCSFTSSDCVACHFACRHSRRLFSPLKIPSIHSHPKQTTKRSYTDATDTDGSAANINPLSFFAKLKAAFPEFATEIDEMLAEIYKRQAADAAHPTKHPSSSDIWELVKKLGAACQEFFEMYGVSVC
jgi:hypothetical protein